MYLIRSLCSVVPLLVLVLNTSTAYTASAVIDYNIKYQTIEGFGGGLSFHKYPYFHPKKEELYDSIFNKAKVNVIRVGNWYDPQADTPVVEVPMMKEIQQRWPHVKTMLASWTPPAYLKSNDSTIGWTAQRDTGTLKKNTDGSYMYDEYGDYWLKSAKYFTGSGMKIDWISIQNEPDWPAEHEGCVLEGRETPTIASYGKAHTAVYNKLKNGLDVMIPMIGPDVAGIYQNRVTRFITSPETNTSEMVAYCHHLYDHPGVEWFTNARTTITGKPIYQTEFLINEGQMHGTQQLSWIDNAWFIHQSLAVEGASMYLVFALAYNPGSMHTFFSQDTTWQTDWYETRNAYYVFKQFSANISRGWKRIEAKCDDPSLLISAYCNDASDSTAIVIINTGAAATTVSLSAPGKVGTVVQTSNTKKYQQTGTLSGGGTVAIDPVSVTTVRLATPSSVITSDRAATTGVQPSFSALSAGGGKLLINGTIPAGPVELSLFDCKGTCIAVHSFRQTGTVPFTHLFSTPLSPGRYLVKLSGKAVELSRTVAVVY
jgi:glucuronoarabinoxylan endo-1,4-beta-xylanase